MNRQGPNGIENDGGRHQQGAPGLAHHRGQCGGGLATAGLRAQQLVVMGRQDVSRLVLPWAKLVLRAHESSPVVRKRGGLHRPTELRPLRPCRR